MKGAGKIIDPTNTDTSFVMGEGSATIKAKFIKATDNNHQHICKTTSKKATYFKAGYKNRQVCTVCGKTVQKGKTIKKLTLKVPKITVKASGKRLKIAYKKVKDANHFQVRYRIKGNWKIKSLKQKNRLLNT